jgi:hypothetical protein
LAAITGVRMYFQGTSKRRQESEVRSQNISVHVSR